MGWPRPGYKVQASANVKVTRTTGQSGSHSRCVGPESDGHVAVEAQTTDKTTWRRRGPSTFHTQYKVVAYGVEPPLTKSIVGQLYRTVCRWSPKGEPQADGAKGIPGFERGVSGEKKWESGH